MARMGVTQLISPSGEWWERSSSFACWFMYAGICSACQREGGSRVCGMCVTSPIACWSARRAGMHHSVISNKNLLFSAHHWEIDGECCRHSVINTIKEWSKQMVETRAGTWLIAALVLQEKRGAEVFTWQHGRSVPHRGWDHWWRVRQILHWTSVVRLDLTSHQSLKFPSTLLSVHLKYV